MRNFPRDMEFSHPRSKIMTIWIVLHKYCTAKDNHQQNLWVLNGNICYTIPILKRYETVSRFTSYIICPHLIFRIHSSHHILHPFVYQTHIACSETKVMYLRLSIASLESKSIMGSEYVTGLLLLHMHATKSYIRVPHTP